MAAVTIVGSQSATLLWLSMIVVLVLLIGTVLVPINPNVGHLAKLKAFEQIYISIGEGSALRYLRRNASDIIIDEYFPRIQGSAFTFHLEGSCFSLSSSNSQWMTIVDKTLKFTSNMDQRALFVIDEDIRWVDNGFITSFKVCASQVVVEVDLHKSPQLIVASIRQTDSASVLGAFRVSKVPFYMGINLGSWFIPEYWMDPSFYAGTGIGWGGSLCSLVNHSKSLIESRMRTHLSTWITERDFQQISAARFNSIRIPIGYWNVVSDPYHRYAPSDVSISLRYLDWAFDMALRYNLSIVLDLHGGPGSQNGQDHSGCSYDILKTLQWTEPRNQELTLRAIDAMITRYHRHPSLLGIELINEPAQGIEEMDHFLLAAFYHEAYQIIRSKSNETLVIFNELYSKCYSWWADVLREPNFYNVVVDWHLYDNMGSNAAQSVSTHMQTVSGWKSLIQEYADIHPIMIGEWSMDMGAVHVGTGQDFVCASELSFRQAVGWYLWTWKVERNLGYDRWDVQYQLNQPNGLRPICHQPK